MANVYVEPRPKGRPEGSHIEDYVVEDHADHVLGTFTTQHEAIDWAKKQGHHPLVARVRHLNDKKTPGHWRTTLLAVRSKPDALLTPQPLTSLSVQERVLFCLASGTDWERAGLTHATAQQVLLRGLIDRASTPQPPVDEQDG